MNDYTKRTANKIKLRERGWEYDSSGRFWHMSVGECQGYEVRVVARTMDAALQVRIESRRYDGAWEE